VVQRSREQPTDKCRFIRLRHADCARHARIRRQHGDPRRGVDNGQIGQQLARATCKRHTVHAARQIDVGEQHIHRVRGEMPQCVGCVRRRLHGEAQFRQRLRYPFADQKLVLNDENVDRLARSQFRFHGGSSIACTFFLFSRS